MVIYELLAMDVPYYETKDERAISKSISCGTLPELPKFVDLQKQQFWISLMNECLRIG